MATANHVLLRRITLSASAASVTFDNIPQTGYTDLKIVYSARSDAATTDRGMFVRFNGDTGSNYTYRFARGDGSSAGSGGTTTTFLYFGNFNAGTSTSNTFGNGEFYIPNYTGSVQKSVSSDSVSENNSSGAWATLAAGLWTGTSAINTILLYPEGGNFVAGSSFSLYGIANAATTPALAPKADGGDIIKTDGTYWYHAFLSSGSFKPQVNLTADVLVVAGGGGGGYDLGGGGGAGGVLYSTAQSLANGTNYSCSVGAGGTGATASPTTAGADGTSSTFSSLTAIGGGGGGSSTTGAGRTGGSGGGGAYRGNGGTATSGQGFAGGSKTSTGNQYASSGGGGAGAIGVNATGIDPTSVGGDGGVGTNTYSSWLTVTGLGVSGYIAGGGGGSSYGTSSTPGNGGTGGGGNGAKEGGGGRVNTTGTVNTGGGGGGGDNATSISGKAGGSGIIIIKYPI